MPTAHLHDDVVLEGIIAAVREHTHALLGITISLSPEDWAGSSHLPGWTRSHVGAHIAAGARALVRVVDSAASGHPARLYPSEREKFVEIEREALASGLEMQIDLDETAGLLDACWARLPDDSREVSLKPGLRICARDLPLIRLQEVVLHTHDLAAAASLLPVPPQAATLALTFLTAQLEGRPDLPPMHLVTDEGTEEWIGGPQGRRIEGPAADLVLWLARGRASDRIRGAFHIGHTIAETV